VSSEPCPLCRGRGVTTVMIIPYRYSGTAKDFKLLNSLCTVCKGAGVVPAKGGLDAVAKTNQKD
jgi:RecJ-like exonuclease